MSFLWHFVSNLSDFEQIFRELWQREDPKKTAFLKAPCRS